MFWLHDYISDPPENCHLTFKKFPKLDFFFQQNWQKVSFFQQNCQWQFCWKNDTFCQFFWKKCQVFGNFLTFKWQFSGGSVVYYVYIVYHTSVFFKTSSQKFMEMYFSYKMVDLWNVMIMLDSFLCDFIFWMTKETTQKPIRRRMMIITSKYV